MLHIIIDAGLAATGGATTGGALDAGILSGCSSGVLPVSAASREISGIIGLSLALFPSLKKQNRMLAVKFDYFVHSVRHSFACYRRALYGFVSQH